MGCHVTRLSYITAPIRQRCLGALPVKRAFERSSSSGALKTVYRNRRGIAAEPPSVS
jgi:hypothetical protein